MAIVLGTPISRDPITHADLGSLEFHLLDGALIEVTATVRFGTMEGNRFHQRHTVSVDFTGDQVTNNLSAAEISALASIRDKVLAYATAQVPA